MASTQRTSNGHVDSGVDYFRQTTLERAQAATLAAVAVRPPPSPVVTTAPEPSGVNGFIRLAKAWLTKSFPKDDKKQPVFNPELLTNQKREWTYMQKVNQISRDTSEPTELFEHFVVVGLHPNTDVSATEAAVREGKGHSRRRSLGGKDLDTTGYQGFTLPTYEPQVLFKYPPAKRLSLKGLSGFCFPNGIQAKIAERTPSMTDFNEIIYGQRHQKCDDQAFVFLLKVANNVTLYGICVLSNEILQRPPAMLAMNNVHAAPPFAEGGDGPHLARTLTWAPRCYCLLSRLPFFDLHFAVLNSIVAQERLDRIRQYMSRSQAPLGRTVSAVPSRPSPSNQTREASSSSIRRTGSLQVAASPTTPVANDREAIWRKIMGLDKVENAGPSEGEGSGGGNGAVANGSAEVRRREEEDEEDYEEYEEDDAFDEDEDDEGEEEDEEVVTEQISIGDDFGVSATKLWAEAHDSNSLRVVVAFHEARIPPPSHTLSFQPLQHLYPIIFRRPPQVPVFTRGEPLEVSRMAACVFAADPSAAPAIQLAAEEAQAVAPWTVACACRALALENILAMLQAALLEKQIMVVCPNPGVLSAIVISLVPMLRPFVWQSVLLPILPKELLAFLEAPVPFAVGVLHKTAEVRQKSTNLIRVNVYKNEVKLPSSLPPLPHHSSLLAQLAPIHQRLAASWQEAAGRPVYSVTEEQASLANSFLAIIREFLEGFCVNLPLHSITDVRPGKDRVSLLLKESYVASFAPRDRPFVKFFANTQLFAVHSDSVLSSTETSS